MTRQDQTYKWFIYSLGLLPIWILDALLLGRYSHLGTKPLLLVLAVVTVAVLEGSTAGAGFGLGVGIVWALGYTGSSAIILFLVLAGMMVGIVAQYALTQGFLGCLFCSAGAMAFLEGFHILWGLFSQMAPAQVLLEIATGEFCITLLWTPLVYLIFRAIFHRVGLDKLA
jgi:hypothetical protein